MKESMVVLQTNVDGEKVICMPITKLQAIEDTASVKTAADNDDYIPLIDSSDDSQMKKIKKSDLFKGDVTIPVLSADPENPANGQIWIKST